LIALGVDLFRPRLGEEGIQGAEHGLLIAGRQTIELL
jgi:hypothetical protein